MKNDISDDTLILYFYNDGLTRAERQAVASALAADAALGDRYLKLCDELSAIAEEPAEPIADDLRARFIDTIDRAAKRESAARAPSRQATHLPSFFWGAAVTAALAIGVGLGAWFASGDPGVAPDTGSVGPGPIAAAAEDTAPFTRSVRVYFRDSRQELGRLDPGSDADRILLVAQLIEHNRLYEKAAEQHGSPELARVLRAFEPVLVKLAAEDLAAGEAEALLAQLNFELDVMLTKLARKPSVEAGTKRKDTRT